MRTVGHKCLHTTFFPHHSLALKSNETLAPAGARCRNVFLPPSWFVDLRFVSRLRTSVMISLCHAAMRHLSFSNVRNARRFFPLQDCIPSNEQKSVVCFCWFLFLWCLLVRRKIWTVVQTRNNNREKKKNKRVMMVKTSWSGEKL